ncbi:hypothetical protein [Brevibacillus brevis]|uniref:hypothetical protein n=1 Tax=Brevibacillus brevis TaxID=1393 RepID=UPI000D0ED07F|nr:hypothetical protein [Brevibacillus brevis]PSJ66238.1 hypothetical protein C7J99_26230 [Brevibacillus brevis]RED21741.1 hypothetical protein DES34_1186 [Brevibacillus brevis]GEC92493.1 hypothetical protein BBR01nite_48240 [Brevibacillus brevis]VEF92604.1 Uncharacterised protein [Brevibacillus brevis]
MKLRVLLKQYGVQATENIINVLLGSHKAKFHFGLGFEYIDEFSFFMPYYNVIVPNPDNESEREILFENIKQSTTGVTGVKRVDGQVIFGCEADEGPFVVTVDDVAYIANSFLGPEIAARLTELGVSNFQIEFLIDQLDTPLVE